MIAAQQAGDKARKTLAQLGVSQKVIASGNTAEEMNQIADGLARVSNAQKRAAIMQTLFGRGGQALLPILMKGRKALQDQLAMVKKYGDYLGVKTVGQLKKMQADQREMGIATQGMKVQLGTALLPVLLQVEKAFIGILKVISPLTRNATLMKGVIIGLAAAFVAYKIAMIAATIATTVFDTAAAPVVGITLGVVAAIALLAIGIYELWKHCKWFRDAVKEAWAMAKQAFAGILQAVQFVWDWVKRNWPLLVGMLFGPFGLAAAAIITHWGTVKTFLLGALDAVRGKAATVAAGITQAFHSVVDAIKGALNTLINGWNALHFKLPGFKVGPVHFGGQTIGLPHVPTLAAGGYVHGAGVALVGERGPELVRLDRGARVSPLPAPEAAVAGAPAGLGATIEIPLYLDGRQVAKSVARVTADKLARR
jgi:hypothetical protein